MSVSTTSELRLPADPDYIIVAKRSAAAFATIAGFDVEAVHDLVIAVAQACENAIMCTASAGGGDCGHLKLTFSLEDQRLEVAVHSSCAKLRVRQVEEPERRVQMERLHQRRAEALARQQAQNELALQLMGLFVDDYKYRMDERAGGLRVRLTKYRVS
jgi:anti-sigma regulatory factor (Ser/Thr protein kinase)